MWISRLTAYLVSGSAIGVPCAWMGLPFICGADWAVDQGVTAGLGAALAGAMIVPCAGLAMNPRPGRAFRRAKLSRGAVERRTQAPTLLHGTVGRFAREKEKRPRASSALSLTTRSEAMD